MQEFERSSRLGDWIGGVRAQFEACSRDCRSSSPVRGLEPGLEEIESTSGLGDWIGGVRAWFEAYSWDCRSSSPLRGLQSGLKEFEISSRLGNCDGFCPMRLVRFPR